MSLLSFFFSRPCASQKDRDLFRASGRDGCPGSQSKKTRDRQGARWQFLCHKKCDAAKRDALLSWSHYCPAAEKAGAAQTLFFEGRRRASKFSQWAIRPFLSLALASSFARDTKGGKREGKRHTVPEPQMGARRGHEKVQQHMHASKAHPFFFEIRGHSQRTARHTLHNPSGSGRSSGGQVYFFLICCDQQEGLFDSSDRSAFCGTEGGGVG